MKFAIVTFGCRVNQADSFDLEGDLRARGATETTPDTADIVIVNTCTVTASADQGARQTIRRLGRNNPRARLVVTGCSATRDPERLRALPQVVQLVPNRSKPELVESLYAGGWAAGSADDDTDGPCGASVPGALGRTAYPLRVQTGCNESCAYCVIPSTRGVSTSRPLADVLAEVGRVSQAGYKELWLVGVHLGSYGRDLQPHTTLLDLARALDATPGDVTFRISSLEPMDCPDALIDLMARSGRFAPHLHLPMQHATDRMLRLMRRPHTAEVFERLVDRVRAAMPDACVGSDFMTGFPGESDADIDDALERLARMPLSALHVFPYSDRPGTEASAMSLKVAPGVSATRAAAVRRVGYDLHARFLERHRGTIRPGLTLEDGTLVVTDNFIKVRIEPGLPRNTRVRVRLTAEGAGRVESVIADPQSS